MRQYMKIKNENPESIVFFRMGDFYETFYEDAKTIAKELEITLTSRGKGEKKAPLAGIPYHSIDPYIAKLVKKGFKIAIVEQVEDPKKAKGLVKRDLVRIITPGTVVEPLILDESANNYLLSFTKEKNDFAVSFCDISTGEFLATHLTGQQFSNELKKINPAEIIFPMSLEESGIIQDLREQNYILHSFDDRHYYSEKAQSTIKDQFNILNMKGFGIDSDQIISCAGALLSYIKETQKTGLSHIQKIKEYRVDQSMYLDPSTIRNLEILRNIIDQGKDQTLLSVLDTISIPMGKRLLRQWITSPLTKKKEIEQRLDAVEELTKDNILRDDLTNILEKIYDMERLVGRVSFGNASPRDLLSLQLSLSFLPKISQLLNTSQSVLLNSIATLPDLSKPQKLIEESIKLEPSITIREGNIIKKGYHQELDQLREIRKNAKSYIAQLEEKEKDRTGIKSLKIKYNKVFGYYIEVTKSNLHLVPKDYIRKQTQVNSERFITEELKEEESKILGAEEKIFELEYQLFMQVIEQLRVYTSDIQMSSQKLAILSCLLSFAQVAQKNNYCKPAFNEKEIVEIEEGRHPVIEQFSDISFVPNSCHLNSKSRTMIITGPNLAGKSTYMRQVALICLMAQIGSFVPAEKANLQIFDRIFTRIGAYDDLVSGQSTFMVEMNETANILNNATGNSLIILDEIGRGTSTYDGVSLAFAIAEYIYTDIQAKTLFATHYHQLNKLADKYEGIKNYNVAVHEADDKITFLRKIMEGGTDKSYGIQVAKLAGVPREVIESSKIIMSHIEMEDEIADSLHKKLNSSSKEKSSPSPIAQKTIQKEQDKDSTLAEFLH